MSQNYTAVRSPELDVLLSGALKEIAREVEALHIPHLAGIVLGGGYGRGEGGVLHTASGDRLYNDLDFFVFADGADRRTQQAIGTQLRDISGRWEKRLGIAVDFSPAKNLDTLPRVARTLMFQELLHGWKPVWGTADPTHWIPALDPAELPYTEALRLLLNRGMGLVFAGERLAAGSDDADFIVRNMNKTVLGCGDALLLTAGRYRWRGMERVDAFSRYADENKMPEEFKKAYAGAFRYKLEPNPVLPHDPRKHWEDCRLFYLDTLRRVAGTSPGAEPGEVAKGLRRKAAGARSVKNFLRWLIRTRSMRSPESIADDPVVSVLCMLCGLLSSSAAYPPCPRKLHELWIKFN